MALKGSGNIAVFRTVFVIDLALRSAVRMSALGHKRTYAVQQPMSALLSIATAKADSRKRSCPLYPESRHFVVHR